MSLHNLYVMAHARVKNQPEVEGELIDWKIAVSEFGQTKLAEFFLLHVAEGIEDYWYEADELELVVAETIDDISPSIAGGAMPKGGEEV